MSTSGRLCSSEKRPGLCNNSGDSNNTWTESSPKSFTPNILLNGKKGLGVKFHFQLGGGGGGGEGGDGLRNPVSNFAHLRDGQTGKRI